VLKPGHADDEAAAKAIDRIKARMAV
jgi:hypothetical protein